MVMHVVGLLEAGMIRRWRCAVSRAEGANAPPRLLIEQARACCTVRMRRTSIARVSGVADRAQPDRLGGIRGCWTSRFSRRWIAWCWTTGFSIGRSRATWTSC